MRSEQPLLLILIDSHKTFMFFLFIIQDNIMNTLGIFDTLEYPWLFMVYIHNNLFLFELNGMVSNEMAFNLLCGELLHSSAQSLIYYYTTLLITSHIITLSKLHINLQLMQGILLLPALQHNQ